MSEQVAQGQAIWPDSRLLRQRHRGWNGGKAMHTPREQEEWGGWAAAAAADLGGGGHADLRDKGVIK